MSESSQRIRNRNDKPRVVLHYEVARDGATTKVPLPFDIGVFADLSGDRKRSENLERRDLHILESKDALEELVSDLKPMVMVEVQTEDNSKRIPIEINSMVDFSPDELLKQLAEKIPGVRDTLRLRDDLLKFREMANIDPEFEQSFRKLSQQGGPALEEFLKRLD